MGARVGGRGWGHKWWARQVMNNGTRPAGQAREVAGQGQWGQGVRSQARNCNVWAQNRQVTGTGGRQQGQH